MENKPNYERVSKVSLWAKAGPNAPDGAKICERTGDFIPKEKCGQAYGIFTTLTTISSIPAPIIGGYLIEHFGYDVPILITATGGLIYALLLAITIKEKQSSIHCNCE